MTCVTCQKDYIHKEGHDCPFLTIAEQVPVKEYVYDRLLAEKAKKFPAYERYLGRGKDYYNEQGIAALLRKTKTQ